MFLWVCSFRHKLCPTACTRAQTGIRSFGYAVSALHYFSLLFIHQTTAGFYVGDYFWHCTWEFPANKLCALWLHYQMHVANVVSK